MGTNIISYKSYIPNVVCPCTFVYLSLSHSMIVYPESIMNLIYDLH